MPKLWLVLLIGYKGTNFHGMQFQLEEHITTVEDVLVEKLHAAGFLATNHHAQLQKQERWSRAARTDKGVHAVFNAVSSLFTVDKSYFDEDNLLNRNKLQLDLRELFEQTEIIYHGFRRVTNRFQIRHIVKSRHYCYVCPKLLFIHKNKTNKQPEPAEQNQEIKEGNKPELSSNQQHEIKQQNQQQEENGNQKQSQLLSRIRLYCSEFVGSHNFHNYSKNLRAKDAQAQRYIIRLDVQSLDENYFIFNIIGQSFIYHQIRKMIGCIIMNFINNYPPTYIPNTFFRNQIQMPLAPARGLYLNNLSFDNYNKKKDIPEPLVFEGVASITEIKNSINQYIIGQDQNQWIQWITNLRQSIYHGIQYVEKEEVDQNTGKTVQED